MITQFQRYLQKDEPCIDHLIMAASFNDLNNIVLNGKNLAILPRSMDLRLGSFLKTLDLSTFPDIQTSFYSYESQKQLELLLKHTTSHSYALHLSINDIPNNSHQFCQLMNTE